MKVDPERSKKSVSDPSSYDWLDSDSVKEDSGSALVRFDSFFILMGVHYSYRKFKCI
jgi:hypothetical protein